MISANSFIGHALERGFDFYTGVPCSFLTPLINGVIGGRALRYVGAASEGEAVAIAAGAWLAGRRTVVMCQNSGLGNAVNPLTSLNAPFRIPTLLVTTWRGQPGHQGRAAARADGARSRTDLLRPDPRRPPPLPDHAGRPDRRPSTTPAPRWTGGPALRLRHGGRTASSRKPCARRHPRPVRRASVRTTARHGEPPPRAAVLERLLSVIDRTSRRHRHHRQMRAGAVHPGRPGAASLSGRLDGRGQPGWGSGVALPHPRPVVVLDGDGAALMKLGTLATIGAYRPPNLIHVLLDNGVHDSTGGQATVSPLVDFPGVALACGYPNAMDCDGLDGFETAYKAAARSGGPSLIHVRIAPGSMAKLGRPTVAPHEVARRFKAFVTRALP